MNDTSAKVKKKMSLHEKDQLKGLVFIAPFLMGVLLFFIYPITLSLRLAFGKIDSIVGMKIHFAGLGSFVKAFFVDVNFLPMFWQSIVTTIVNFPLTVVLSLIIAILLNRDIKCRGLFRVIFFIPFLLGSGAVMQQLLNQGVAKSVLNISDGRLIPYNVLAYFGPTIMDAVQTVFSVLIKVLWGSGVQILLFLSGLQSISPSLYEAAKIDGATEWEIFWKVTIPMISPIMLLVMVFTLVASFTDLSNPLLGYMQTYGFQLAEFEYAAAMGWIYFAFIGLIIALVFGIMKKYMHTNEVEEVKKKREHKRRVFTIEKAPKRTY